MTFGMTTDSHFDSLPSPSWVVAKRGNMNIRSSKLRFRVTFVTFACLPREGAGKIEHMFGEKAFGCEPSVNSERDIRLRPNWRHQPAPQYTAANRAASFFRSPVHPRRVPIRISSVPIPRAQEIRTSIPMKKTIIFALSAVALSGAAFAAHHESMGHKAPMVGGAAMMPSDNIVTNASKANNLKTLVAAVQAAGLVDTLASPGPFTVFAPTDAAFAKLPAGTVDTLVKPENKGTLTTILTYHVVPGKVTAQNVMAAIRAGKGQASLTTVQGGKLTARMVGKQLVLTDAKGGKSTVTQANVMQSNGVVHVINSVLMP